MKEPLKIVKIGGHIINDEVALDSFLRLFSELTGNKVLIHGGGKLATELAEKLNIPVQLVDGRRITDAQTLAIVTMVYAGKISKDIVAKLQSYGCNAIGLSGADANIILAKKRAVKEIDYGYAGDITKVNSKAIELLLSNNITPCFSAISHDGNGQLLNTNADTIAAELAIALSDNYEVDLYYCFEKRGVLLQLEDEDSVVENIDPNLYEKMKQEKIIAAGMLPKLDNSFYALGNGVSSIHLGKTSMIFNENEKHTTIEK